MSTTVGKNPLEEMEQQYNRNKRVQNAVLGCNLKNDRMISIPFQGKTFNNTTIQVYAPITSAKEAEVDQFYEDRQHLKEMFYSSLVIGMQK